MDLIGLSFPGGRLALNCVFNCRGFFLSLLALLSLLLEEGVSLLAFTLQLRGLSR